MNDETRHVFYASKPRILHMALNIAIAPVLLYLLGAWKWPPVLPHYIVFAMTSLMALVAVTGVDVFQQTFDGAPVGALVHGG